MPRQEPWPREPPVNESDNACDWWGEDKDPYGKRKRELCEAGSSASGSVVVNTEQDSDLDSWGLKRAPSKKKKKGKKGKASTRNPKSNATQGESSRQEATPTAPSSGQNPNCQEAESGETAVPMEMTDRLSEEPSTCNSCVTQAEQPQESSLDSASLSPSWATVSGSESTAVDRTGADLGNGQAPELEPILELSGNASAHSPVAEGRENADAGAAPRQVPVTKRKTARRAPRGRWMEGEPPKPVFCDYPVIMEDRMTTEAVRLRSLDWKMADILRSQIGSVRTIKAMGPKKTLIGCSNAQQQQKLLRLEQVGGVTVRNTVPCPTVEGVVRGIPTYVTVDLFLSRVDGFDGTDCKIRKVVRLTLKDGTPSTCMKVIFEATVLPELMQINKREYRIDPYVPQVVRCYRCQRLGHVQRQCTAKTQTCPTCGQKGHDAKKCTAKDKHCTNCSGSHSAVYFRCPAKRQWSLAGKFRAEVYMPRAHAFHYAKKQMAREAKVASGTAAPEPTPAPTVAWRRECERPTKPDCPYANAVKRHMPAPNQAKQPEKQPAVASQKDTGLATVSETQTQGTPDTPELRELMMDMKNTIDQLKAELAAERAERQRLQARLDEERGSTDSELTQRVASMVQACFQEVYAQMSKK